MSKIEKYLNELILMVILLVAAVLRFYNYSELSITCDEVSALLRLKFDTVKEVIDLGVRPDGHPAGVQVLLYYWTELFGISEASIRFPFVISGILVVWFAYLIPAYCFNKTAGLLCAAAFCFLQFPLIYSQIARPYSPGLLFTLMSTWFWALVLFRPHTRMPIKIIGYVVATTLAIYMHYFSFFQVIIIGLSGFLFLTKENYKGYIISAIGIFILFTPHLGISIAHLKIGGLQEAAWLGSPDNDTNWFLKYLFYAFNNSYSLICLVLLILSGSIYYSGKNIIFSRYHYLFIAWFIIPFLVGYFYSVLVNPVLQRSVLIFSFPFLIFLIFSLVKEVNKPSVKVVATMGFLIFGVVNTVYGQSFYKSNFFGVLKEIAESSVKSIEKYGTQNITKTTNIVHPYFIDYYLDRQEKPIEYVAYVPDPQKDRYINNGREELGKIIDIVNNSSTDYYLYCWSGKYSPNEITEIIQDKYPCIVERDYYFNSEYYVFSKVNGANCIDDDLVFQSTNDFESQVEPWTKSTIGRAEKIVKNRMQLRIISLRFY